MSRSVIIIDCETTSLAPDYETGSGIIWELAAIRRDTGAAFQWRMKPDLSVADPAALRVGQFYHRTEDMLPGPIYRACNMAVPLKEWEKGPEWSSKAKVAAEAARLLDDAILVAANPAFDAAFIATFLRHYDEAPTWHYRLRDIGSMAYGYLANEGMRLPAIDASTDVFAEALGVDPGKFERHSALGDCRLVGAMLDVIDSRFSS